MACNFPHAKKLAIFMSYHVLSEHATEVFADIKKILIKPNQNNNWLQLWKSSGNFQVKATYNTSQC